MASDNAGRKFPSPPESDRAGGQPQKPQETPDGFTVSGEPRNLNAKGGAKTGTDLDRMPGGTKVDGSPGSAPSSDDALAGYGGLRERSRISSLKVVREGYAGEAATIPNVPITADPANEGG